MKATAGTLALALVVAITSAGNAGEPAPDVDCSTGGRTQAEINRCAAAEADTARSPLDDLLSTLRTKLSASEWQGLQSVQDEWHRFAEHQCKWEASLVEGGSIAHAAGSFCRRTLTRQRIEVLENFLCEGA